MNNSFLSIKNNPGNIIQDSRTFYVSVRIALTYIFVHIIIIL